MSIPFSLPDVIDYVKANPDKVLLCGDRSGEIVIATGLVATKDENDIPVLIPDPDGN